MPVPRIILSPDSKKHDTPNPPNPPRRDRVRRGQRKQINPKRATCHFEVDPPHPSHRALLSNRKIARSARGPTFGPAVHRNGALDEYTPPLSRIRPLPSPPPPPPPPPVDDDPVRPRRCVGRAGVVIRRGDSIPLGVRVRSLVVGLRRMVPVPPLLRRRSRHRLRGRRICPPMRRDVLRGRPVGRGRVRGGDG